MPQTPFFSGFLGIKGSGTKTILPDFLLYVKPEYMENVLKYLRKKYETVENYLLLKGIPEKDIDKLKDKLLD